MTNLAQAQDPSAAPVADAHWSARLAALEQAGAQRLDPVRLHYIGVLAARMAAHQGTVQRLLQAKLDAAVADLAARLEQSRLAALAAATATPQKPAQAQPPVPVEPPARATLADLTRRLARTTASGTSSASGVSTEAVAPGAAPQPPELHAVRQFRNTWSKLSADKQVAQALGQAPKNAGPINSHMLVLRSLELMRHISPDYLNRFMAYADTLLCLDHADSSPTPTAKPRRTRAS